MVLSRKARTILAITLTLIFIVGAVPAMAASNTSPRDLLARAAETDPNPQVRTSLARFLATSEGVVRSHESLIPLISRLDQLVGGLVTIQPISPPNAPHMVIQRAQALVRNYRAATANLNRAQNINLQDLNRIYSQLLIARSRLERLPFPMPIVIPAPPATPADVSVPVPVVDSANATTTISSTVAVINPVRPSIDAQRITRDRRLIEAEIRRLEAQLMSRADAGIPQLIRIAAPFEHGAIIRLIAEVEAIRLRPRR